MDVILTLYRLRTDGFTERGNTSVTHSTHASSNATPCFSRLRLGGPKHYLFAPRGKLPSASARKVVRRLPLILLAFEL